jgi:hypothetical protein
MLEAFRRTKYTLKAPELEIAFVEDEGGERGTRYVGFELRHVGRKSDAGYV